ncbi:MAG TPA: ATP-binding protein, partial [Marinobacter sp.]|nr:ATP-binding protein [Marinobacter sp.]
SHIESGHLTLNPEPFVLQALLQDVERLFQPRAEAVGTRLAVHYDGNPEDTFMGDATRLRQVLINLVNNAVKFTPNGDITLGVHKAQQTDSTVELQFSVSDTGPGIPQADQHRIFESFEQLDNSPTRVHGGSGLGLAICRQIIRAMGSDFTLVSEPGQGSTFAFSIQLPALLSEGNDEPLTNARSVSHALVIDDNEVNRKVLENLLQRLGIRVVYTAGSARRGLALLENLQPDLVFVDLHMPGMDGMGFLATARTEFAERGRAMPFTVACTADVGDQQKRACLAAGFDAHLGKPVSVAAVKKLVRSLGLSLPDSPDRIESDGAAQPEFVTRSVLNIDALKRSFLGNEDLLQEFLGLLKENLPTHIERIDEALGLGNITAHYDAAHSIKGLVGYFEDPQLMTLVTDLETAMKRGDIDTAKARFAPVRQLLDTLLKDIRALLKKLS